MKPYFIATLFYIQLFSSCNTSVQKTLSITDRKADSAEFFQLTLNLLNWTNANKHGDFEPLLMHPTDTLYAGIDWAIHKKRMEQIKETGFFTRDFLEHYQKVAEYIDKQWKETKIKYYVNMIPPYPAGDFDVWCNCQGWPGDFKTSIYLRNIKDYNDSASFQWVWKKEADPEESSYTIKLKKENDKWRIDYLEGFEFKNFTFEQ